MQLNRVEGLVRPAGLRLIYLIISKTVIVTPAVTKIAGRVSFAISFDSGVWK